MSVYIIAPLCAWLLAQGLKVVFRKSRHGVMDFYHLYRSGGMPSAHSAVVVSLATIVGLKVGWDSVDFGIAAILAMIVIYDAMNVRYIVGEQGKILAKLLASHEDLSKSIKAPKIIRGHTLGEVIGGTVLGLAVAVIIFLLENS